MILYALIGIVCVLYYIHRSIHGKEKAKLFNKIPGPKIWPVVGNGLDINGGPVELFYKGRQLGSVFKKINKIWILHIPIINLYDPRDLETVLSSTKHITKGDVYSFLHPWLNEGLLTSTGKKWQTRRKILTTTFHFNILKEFCNTFVEQSEKLVNKLKSEVGKSETEILPYITDFALYSICETAMGTNLEISDESVKYKRAIYQMGDFVVKRFSKLWLRFTFLFNMSTLGKAQKKVLSALHQFTTNVIRERRIERNQSGNKFEVQNIFNDELISTKKRLAMLDLLLTAESEGQINEEGIREEVDTFMFEGHDTTTMAITFSLMLFANNPHIQDKIVAEVDEIYDKLGGPITIQELNNMNYLERCIKESLRLYPSVPFISRMIKEDLDLRGNFVPAGTTCNIHIFDIHRDEEYFPNPDKFDPDRFLPENSANRHAYAYVPFSAGPRNCIGQKFAILEEKAVLSAILRNYKLEAITRPDDIVFTSDLVLRCKDPVKVRFVARK